MSANGHKSPREKAIYALQCNNGRMPLHELNFRWGVNYKSINDMLERADCPFRLEFVRNANGGREPKTFVVLKHFEKPKPVTQQQTATMLNSMTEAEYREYLRRMDCTFLARSQRRGYRRGGISADEYLGYYHR